MRQNVTSYFLTAHRSATVCWWTHWSVPFDTAAPWGQWASSSLHSHLITHLIAGSVLQCKAPRGLPYSLQAVLCVSLCACRAQEQMGRCHRSRSPLSKDQRQAKLYVLVLQPPPCWKADAEVGYRLPEFHHQDDIPLLLPCWEWSRTGTVKSSSFLSA